MMNKNKEFQIQIRLIKRKSLKEFFHDQLKRSEKKLFDEEDQEQQSFDINTSFSMIKSMNARNTFSVQP